MSATLIPIDFHILKSALGDRVTLIYIKFEKLGNSIPIYI